MDALNILYHNVCTSCVKEEAGTFVITKNHH